MTHYRKIYRDTVRSALQADAAFTDFTVMSAWAHNLDIDDVPAFGVATPQETKRLDSLDSSERETQLVVILKIKGGDAIEDLMDGFSELVEPIVITALSGPASECLLTNTTTKVDGGGEVRVGTLTMEFSVKAWLAEPLAE